MKNKLLYACILFSASTGLAATTFNQDKWLCRATCISIDQQTGIAYDIGSISGRSEIDTDEAFKVMKKACEDQVETSGISGEIYLVKGFTVGSSDRSSEETSTRKTNRFKLGYLVNYSKASSDKVTTKKSELHSFTLEIEAADESNCGPLTVTPGMPKYLGEGTPLS
jgi:hypothetical protein